MSNCDTCPDSSAWKCTKCKTVAKFLIGLPFYDGSLVGKTMKCNFFSLIKIIFNFNISFF